MSVGELADASGVGVETVRFYEREGLLPEPPRTGGGNRVYDADAVRRVRFILRASANEQTGECPFLDALEDGSATGWEE